MESGQNMEEIAGQSGPEMPESAEKPGDYISELERQVQDATTGPTGLPIDAPMKEYQNKGAQVALRQLGEQLSTGEPTSPEHETSELSD